MNTNSVICLFSQTGPMSLSGCAKKSEGSGNMSMIPESQGHPNRAWDHRVFGSVLLISPYLCFLSLLSSATQGKLCLIN